MLTVLGIQNARQYFFDTTPSGRILGRFSRDTDLIDDNLPGVIQDVTSCSVASLGTLALICILTPVSIPLMLPIIFMYWRIQKGYIPASRQMKRLESASRSPIYSFIQDLGCDHYFQITSFEILHSFVTSLHIFLASNELMRNERVLF